MTDLMKQEYTLRITQANRSQLTVIIYEMLLQYVEDICEAHEREDRPAFREGIRKARGCVNELMRALDFQYDLSSGLLQLYVYVNKQLMLSDIRNKVEELDIVKKVISGLHDSFEKVSQTDHSSALMQNTQDVYVGLTYGKKNLTESVDLGNKARGFSV